MVKKSTSTAVLCKCDGCGIEFYKELRHYKRTRTHYCSRECWCKNNKHDKIQCEKISKAKTGAKHPHLSGENHPNWQPDRNRYCIDCGEKLVNRQESQRCWECHVKYHRGENSHSYIDGRTPLILELRACHLYRDWRAEIYKRDKYTCVQCNERKKDGKFVKIEAHHKKAFIDIITENNIKSYEDAVKCKELWDINNGETLCQYCHKEKHKIRLKVAV